MAKGMFSQGVALLTDGTTTIGNLKQALEHHNAKIAKEVPGGEHWEFSGDSLIIPFLPQVNGYAAVDVVNRPWPDDMGDPKASPFLFGAWTMGHFGPFAFPGSLERAGQHSWTWAGGRTVAQGHRGFVRMRTSYTFGAADDAPVLPTEYDPVNEMMFLSRVTVALLGAPGVLCYFNPNGEVLRDRKSFVDFWKPCTAAGKIPLQLWSNVRLFKVNDRLTLMDTVGHAQLDVRDVEAVFPTDRYNPRDVDYYLRNVAHYLLDLGRDIETGEAIDGPGETNLSWTVEQVDQSPISPPRRLLRLYPKDQAAQVRAALAD